jgi:hypothetical protein
VLQRFSDLRSFALGPLEVGKETAVIEGEGNPAGEDPGEVRIIAPVAPPGPSDAEGQRPGYLTPCLQGESDRGPHAKPPQKLEVGAVVVGEFPQLSIRHPLNETGVQRVALVPLDHALRQRRFAGPKPALDIGAAPRCDPHRDPPRLIAFDHVDRADVGELGNEDIADRRERLLQRTGGFGGPRDFAEDLEAMLCGPAADQQNGEPAAKSGQGDCQHGYDDQIHLPPESLGLPPKPLLKRQYLSPLQKSTPS